MYFCKINYHWRAQGCNYIFSLQMLPCGSLEADPFTKSPHKLTSLWSWISFHQNILGVVFIVFENKKMKRTCGLKAFFVSLKYKFFQMPKKIIILRMLINTIMTFVKESILNCSQHRVGFLVSVAATMLLHTGKWQDILETSLIYKERNFSSSHSLKYQRWNFVELS